MILRRMAGLCSTLLFCFPLLSQTTVRVSSTEVLASFRDDSLYQQLSAGQVWSEEQNWKGSWLRQLEIRGELNELNVLDNTFQEYTFRLSPRSIRETRLRNARLASASEPLALERIALQEDLLAERYQMLTEASLTEKARALELRKTQVLKEKIRLLALQLGDPRFDPVDLVKAETDLLKAGFELGLHQDQLLDQHFRIKSWLGLPDSTRLVLDSLLPATGLGRVDFFRPSGHLSARSQAAIWEAEDQQQALELERSQQWRFLDFVQVKVRTGDLTFAQPEFSIGLGLNLPLPREIRSRTAVHRLELKQAEFDLRQVRMQEQARELRLWQRFQIRLKRWGELRTSLEQGFSRQTFERLRRSADADPLVLVQIQAAMLEQETLMLRAEEALLAAYLDWIEASGVLSAPVLRDYLSPGFAEIP